MKKYIARLILFIMILAISIGVGVSVLNFTSTTLNADWPPDWPSPNALWVPSVGDCWKKYPVDCLIIPLN